MAATYERAREFLYRNARPLDIARFQYHFENGGRDAALTALAAYQNEDGGFGHALEADSWNPNSTPIQTWTATEILREIGFTDASHPITRGILRYLASGKDFQGHLWYNTVKSNNDYPHAPWWRTENDSISNNDYNPTACLAGFALRFAGRDGELYRMARRVAKEAFDFYTSKTFVDIHTSSDLLADSHTAACFARLLEYVVKSGITDLFDVSVLREKLKRQVKFSITDNTAKWETSYVTTPSFFFNDRDSVYYSDNKDVADYECEFICKTCLDDGSWNIPWSWAGAYPEEWAVSKNWWKGGKAVLNLLYLKGMGKL
ncbi:MAG: hypothetical protein LBS11_10020 [Oscillospiraceae bacterium]|jgi:hypothetical protein|nr:hypothetical protein [Oscillospiraceae bacterium]